MLPKRMSQNPKKIDLRNQAGFTLVEIIAVLVILSILAVVAVPRYFDLQANARDRAMEGAMAEAIGRINGYFAQQLLGGALPAEIQYTAEGLPTDTIGSDLGDFTLSIVSAGITLEVDGVSVDGLELTITASDESAIRGATPLTRVIPVPGITPGG